MNVEKIERLEDIVPLDKGSTITEHQIKRLTAPGENYGSLMLSVDITVTDNQEKEQIIHAVAKMVPPNDFIQEVFNTQVTFRNEIGFYNNIVPALRQFQREQGIEKLVDFFPKYYGSRISLNADSTKVDSDAVLLLENLKILNFDNLERTVGFDLETSKLIIEDLAHLHAVPLGLKLKKPEIFENEVKRFLTPLVFKEDPNFNKKLLDVVASIDECKPYLERVKAVVNKGPKRDFREPFATVSHNDVWVNNTMVQIVEGRPVKNKLVDFQVLDYGSPAKDLLFFVFSSVRNDILEQYSDYLIKFYHETFIQILEDLKCDTTPFSWQNFTKELEEEAYMQFTHTIFMFFPIFAPKGSVAEISEIKQDDFLKSADYVPEEQKVKLALVVKEFAKRNWI